MRLFLILKIEPCYLQNSAGNLKLQISVESEVSIDYTAEIPELRSDILNAIRELLFELESRY